MRWCQLEKVDSFSPTVAQLTNYLATLHASGLQFSSIAVTRAAVVSFLTVSGFRFSVEDERLLSRFMKGLF